jgi:hypothetical protein
LEDAISRFHGTEDTILYISCFDANAGLILDDMVYNYILPCYCKHGCNLRSFA